MTKVHTISILTCTAFVRVMDITWNSKDFLDEEFLDEKWLIEANFAADKV